MRNSESLQIVLLKSVVLHDPRRLNIRLSELFLDIGVFKTTKDPTTLNEESVIQDRRLRSLSASNPSHNCKIIPYRFAIFLARVYGYWFLVFTFLETVFVGLSENHHRALSGVPNTGFVLCVVSRSSHTVFVALSEKHHRVCYFSQKTTFCVFCYSQKATGVCC